MQIEYLADYPEYISELARLHFDEWSYSYPGESLEGRTARLRSSCGRNAIPSVVVALEDGELLARLCSSLMTWIRAHNSRRGSPVFLSNHSAAGKERAPRL